MNLSELGWGNFFQQQVSEEELNLHPARVYRQDMKQYLLMSDQGDLVGLLPGKQVKEAVSKADLPTVGDWVLTSIIPGAEQGTVQIERLLERKSRFSRKEAGEVVDEQVIAANIDTAFVVSALNEDFNPNRIERYLLLSQNSGALPVVVLNKADLCDDLDKCMDALRLVAGSTPVHVVSAKDGAGLDTLKDYIGKGSTCAFMGSSGVGKSTIINALLGEERFATGEIREDDGKGRHTTTFREMVTVPGGGLIIDTPGMREIQLWADAASLAQSFEDIESLSLQCRFSDCRHRSEPGCAVTAAISSGELPQERLDRYFKLAAEVAHFESQESAASRAEKKQERKRFSKMVRKLPNKRD